jgi:hypothetical protein
MDAFTINFLEMIRRAEELAEWIRIQRDAGRSKGPSDDIAQMCLQETGLPFPNVQRSSPEALSDLLHQGANFYGRAAILAELLILESEFNEENGDASGAIRARLQAFCLLGESLGALAPEEQAIYREKMDLLAGQLRDASHDPYLAQKLGHFGY